ncbi:MAG: cysteine desulfurase [Bacteroidia bacterium]|nr:cysteine desulfurase [Bacteroidia bacterium]
MLSTAKYKTLDAERIRQDFPILKRKVNNVPLIYFDNGATSQKPEQVINAITTYYQNFNANIHRGVHALSREATEAFEQARKTIADYFNVQNDQQLIFTAGTTDSLNIIAGGLGRSILKPGDEILLSSYEHHSNILPWQIWAEDHQGVIKAIPLKKNQSLDYDKIEDLITTKTKLISITHVSNTLGLVTDLEKIKEIAKKHNLIVVVDGAQSVPHMKVDLKELDVDFFVCSAHKMYGPTGTGLLYMSEKWLKKLPVSKPGGGTIKTVSFSKAEYAEGALRFEPGTPNIEGVIGFAEAVKYIQKIGIDSIHHHESELVNYAQDKLTQIPEVEVYGLSSEKAGVISFNVKKQHPFDVGTLLDKFGIAVRTGHHCTQPLMEILGVPGTVRISFGMYNTKAEVDFFIEKLRKTISMLQ